MKQLSKAQSILYHFYPGVIITFFFILITPILLEKGFPPQFSMLLAGGLVVVPVFLIHLRSAKSKEGVPRISDLMVYKEKIPTKKMVLYTAGLILFAFLIYGLTQPLNVLLTEKLLFWLPDWYQVRDFEGYSKKIILITLLLNLLLNGLLAPFFEELYFRGYLLPRMETWGKYAPVLSAVLFSLYHFWQPQIYLTLILALLPMTYLVWKTQSLRLAIYVHCGLNIIGTLLSLGMLGQ
ncbi:CPBP family intramembrane metalloprotease [Algoriphagus lutimaris]|uniref:CPBP family intramembrane glutamic endopeptidase n=1 Tax=Algoriphagus lutimaris TaxID=613197 RepID=UPI00196A5EDA|nr:CPBP family intramembrane glutamic endopeptidase [Algoriphagus lutimaris]MBN3520368.1 CPBP family intramembrane metalloprotease [Algoriphagus lutimaris]